MRMTIFYAILFMGMTAGASCNTSKVVVNSVPNVYLITVRVHDMSVAMNDVMNTCSGLNPFGLEVHQSVVESTVVEVKMWVRLPGDERIGQVREALEQLSGVISVNISRS